MQITIQIMTDKLVHAKPNQFGSIVAHVMKSKHFAKCELWKTCINVTFNVGDTKALAEVADCNGPALEQEVIALLDLEPYPCPCGCGQFLAIGPCFRQSGELVEVKDATNIRLDEEEKALLRQANKIGAIKHLRDRYGKCAPDTLNPGSLKILGLRECVDACDLWLKNPY